ncbi:MAG: DUF4175 family protein [Deltaproteobacteria bacterium]|nr:MAG: DUF4175 family protein [Deltaproteobacteria bacterium]
MRPHRRLARGPRVRDRRRPQVRHPVGSTPCGPAYSRTGRYNTPATAPGAAAGLRARSRDRDRPAGARGRPAAIRATLPAGSAVDSFDAIHAGLARVRRRLVGQAAAAGALIAGAVAALAGVVAPLAASAVGAARAPSVAGAAVGAAVAAAAAAAVRYAAARRRWRSDEAVARYLGGSDLLSAVQLERASRAAFSRELIDALADQTARQLAGVDVAAAVPARRLRAPAAIASAAAAVVVAASAAAPGSIAHGWRLALAAGDDAIPGAQTSAAPVVGDIEIHLEYPGYTGRPAVTLPSASGDFRAMPGTKVSLRARPLAPARAAKLLFERDGGGDRDPLVLQPAGDAFAATWTVRAPARYRFYVERIDGPPAVDAEAHAIEIEPDEPPAIELYAPADELDVEGKKRVELAWTAEDDYGLRTIDLVWTGDDDAEAGRARLWTADDPRRTSQGRYLWDLAEVDLRPGTRVAYHLEAADNDDVSGPNVAKSKTFYLRVFSKRERHEQLVDRQAELFEKLVAQLGGRLVVAPADVDAHRALHAGAQTIAGDVGAIVAALADDDRAGDDLRAALGAMHARLRALVSTEAKLLDAGAPAPAQLARGDANWVQECERDVLLMADWIDRQRLENVLALTDEIADRRKRIAALFEQYERTGDPDTLAEIERELRALERDLAALSRKQTSLGEDVLDRYVNAEALADDEGEHCLAEVRRLLAAGDAAAAQRQMAKCNALFDDAQQQLEQALSTLRGDKFTEQQRQLDELMSELADLAQDQKDTARRADDLMQRYSEATSELLEDKAKEVRAEADRLIQKLRRRIDRVPKAGLTPFSKEELPIAKQRLDDVAKMLRDGDLAEALAMARQALNGLETVEAELGADLDSGEPWSDRTGDAYNQVARAVPLARKLVELLDAATPSPQQIMSPADRDALRQLRRRQRAIRRRTERLRDRARKIAGELPGSAGQAMADGLGEAVGHMEGAEQRMRAGDPPGARQRARDAADALERARQSARDAARQRQAGGRGLRDEPVRIPGADEYRAPEAFREEILEAMKKDKPPGFAEQIRRYYEELIK